MTPFPKDQVLLSSDAEMARRMNLNWNNTHEMIAELNSKVLHLIRTDSAVREWVRKLGAELEFQEKLDCLRNQRDQARVDYLTGLNAFHHAIHHGTDEDIDEARKIIKEARRTAIRCQNQMDKMYEEALG